MKTRQIHGLGLGEFLIFAPAKEMLKSAYFFSALAEGWRIQKYKCGLDYLTITLVAVPLARTT